jgi:hypothetical protein
MKTTITKELRHSLLIEEEDVKSLYGFISSRYKEVKVTANCIDGSKLESKEIDEIISFENPNYRKIKSLSFYAYNDINERLSLNFWTDRAFTTAELEIESNNDEQALYSSHEILNKLAELKPWYDLLTRFPISYVVVGLWSLYSMIYTINQLIGERPPSSVLDRYSTFELINFAIVIVLIVFAIIYPFDWVQKQLFPKVFFLLGKQKKTMETIKKWRGFIFSGLILAIATGIIGNAISNWLLK